jgi:catechol 2,3-dioxygenase-like lactoylglutathione lyase family enzyme
MLHSLDHVIVAVSDLAQATETYTRLFGRAPSWCGSHPGWGTANTLFRVANTYLELIAVAGDGALGRELSARLAREGEGLMGMAFGTDDAAECAVELRARGISASEPAEQSGHDERTGAKRTWRNTFLPSSATRGLFLFAIEHLTPPDTLPLAPFAAPQASAVAALDHVVVRSADAEATRAFYGERLGLRLALDRSFPERGVRLMFFRVGGVTVEIASQLSAPADASAPDRYFGLAWRVPDAEAARERLVAAGFSVSATRAGHKPGTRVCTVDAGTHRVPTLLIEPGSDGDRR